MFVFISIGISIAILAILFHISKHHQTSLKRKYEIIVLLRQLLLLSRQHRAVTHQALTKTNTYDVSPKLSEINDLMMRRSNELISIAKFENKPMYRILQLKLKSLGKNWESHSVARNQVIHGKTIRHCLFLMDEVAIAWLVEEGREDLSEEYHVNWQQVLDSMETLTQLRISIQNCHYPEGMLRVKYYCDKMLRKLNHLSIISPLALASPASSKSMHMLTEISTRDDLAWNIDDLYQLTTEISLIISQVYDQMLSDMTESLYEPLPRLVLN